MGTAANTRSHVSSKGQVVIPKAIRDAKGLGVGSEVEFVDHPEGVLMKLPQRKKYTLQDLIGCLPYNGPPITEEMIKAGIDAALTERWERKERNSRS